MAKASKPKPATKPPKPVLSSAARAAQRENAKAYKNAKASTLASAAPRKGPRYHDVEDDDNNANNNADDDGDDREEGQDQTIDAPERM